MIRIVLFYGFLPTAAFLVTRVFARRRGNIWPFVLGATLLGGIAVLLLGVGAGAHDKDAIGWAILAVMASQVAIGVVLGILATLAWGGAGLPVWARWVMGIGGVGVLIFGIRLTYGLIGE